MECHAVVHARLGEPQEIAHVVGRLVGHELERDVAGTRLDHRAIGGKLCRTLGGKRLRTWRRLVSNAYRLHGDTGDRMTFLVDGHAGYFLRHEHAFDDAAEHIVHAVERGLIRDADEELRTAAVGVVRADDRRHRPARVLLAVALGAQHQQAAGAVRVRFRRIFGERIAALNNRVFDHAVNDRAVVAAFLRRLDEVADVVRRGLRQQINDDRAEVGLDDGLLALHLIDGERGREQLRCGSRL